MAAKDEFQRQDERLGRHGNMIHVEGSGEVEPERNQSRSCWIPHLKTIGDNPDTLCT